MNLNYQIIEDETKFARLQTIWDKLLEKSCCTKTFFLQWHWQFNWWKHFGGHLHIVLLQKAENGECIAIFPLLIESKPGFSILRFIGSPDSDYLDFIIKSGLENKALDFFFNGYLAQSRIGALELDAMSTASPNYNSLKSLSGSYRIVKRIKKPCPFIDLPVSWDTYLNTLSAKSRYYIRRKIRKAEKDFSVHVGIAQQENLQNRFQQMIQQHQQVWKSRQRPGAFARKNFRVFHQAMLQPLLDRNQLKLFYLELNGQPAASYYLFQHKRQYLFYLSGFNPDFAHYSPSVVLLAKILQTAIAEGIEEFDMLRGSARYKYQWTQKQRMNESLIIQKPVFKVNMYYYLCTIFGKIRNQLKKCLPAPLKTRIRNLLPAHLMDKLDLLFR